MKKFSWSYSALTMFEQCRKKYFHIKVARDAKDEDSQFAGEGKIIHDAMKKRVLDGVPLPVDLRYLESTAAKFAGAKGDKRGELQLAITDEFKPTAWNDWNGAWLRVIIDLLIIRDNTAIIVDWKTGKVREDWDQLKLCAAVLSCVMPEIENFTSTFVWTKSRHVSQPLTMQKEHMADVWADIMPRVQEITEALKITDFPATKTHLCKFCPVRQCPHFSP